MKINNYTIPVECRHISVEASNNHLIITFEPDCAGDFHCIETDHVESVPTTGDLAIFWEENDSRSAIIARMDDYNVDDDIDGKALFQAANGIWYEHAMRFRSDEQYNKITQK